MKFSVAAIALCAAMALALGAVTSNEDLLDKLGKYPYQDKLRPSRLEELFQAARFVAEKDGIKNPLEIAADLIPFLEDPLSTQDLIISLENVVLYAQYEGFPDWRNAVDDPALDPTFIRFILPALGDGPFEIIDYAEAAAEAYLTYVAAAAAVVTEEQEGEPLVVNYIAYPDERNLYPQVVNILKQLKQIQADQKIAEQKLNDLDFSDLASDARATSQKLDDLNKKIDHLVELINAAAETKPVGPDVDPAVVDPAVVDPAVVDPAVVDPAVVEPAVVEPAVVEPAVVDPVVVEPLGPVIEPIQPVVEPVGPNGKSDDKSDDKSDVKSDDKSDDEPDDKVDDKSNDKPDEPTTPPTISPDVKEASLSVADDTYALWKQQQALADRIAQSAGENHSSELQALAEQMQTQASALHDLWRQQQGWIAPASGDVQDGEIIVPQNTSDADKAEDVAVEKPAEDITLQSGSSDSALNFNNNDNSNDNSNVNSNSNSNVNNIYIVGNRGTPGTSANSANEENINGTLTTVYVTDVPFTSVDSNGVTHTGVTQSTITSTVCNKCTEPQTAEIADGVDLVTTYVTDCPVTTVGAKGVTRVGTTQSTVTSTVCTKCVPRETGASKPASKPVAAAAAAKPAADKLSNEVSGAGTPVADKPVGSKPASASDKPAGSVSPSSISGGSNSGSTNSTGHVSPVVAAQAPGPAAGPAQANGASKLVAGASFVLPFIAALL